MNAASQNKMKFKSFFSLYLESFLFLIISQLFLPFLLLDS